MEDHASIAVKNNDGVLPQAFRSLYSDLVQYVYYSPEPRARKYFASLHEQLGMVIGLQAFESDRVCLLGSGDSGLRAEFYRANKIQGHREHDRGLRTTDDLLRFLALWQLIGTRSPPPGLARVHRWLSSVDTFVVVADQSITGSSLSGDIRLVEQLLRVVTRSRTNTRLLALALIGTHQAAKVLESHADSVCFSEVLPSRYSVRDPGSPFNIHAVPEVRQLAEWFAEHVLPQNGHVHRMSRLTGNDEIALFGFGGQGWLFATAQNTPNTSLPLLWSDHPPRYMAPYPRVCSRLYKSHRWNLRAEYWEIIEGLGIE